MCTPFNIILYFHSKQNLGNKCEHKLIFLSDRILFAFYHLRTEKLSRIQPNLLLYTCLYRLYCSMTPESRNSLLLGNGSVNRFPRKWKCTQQQTNPFLSNGSETQNNKGIVNKRCFLCGSRRYRCYATARMFSGWSVPRCYKQDSLTQWVSCHKNWESL
jgi:hypothetical protein